MKYDKFIFNSYDFNYETGRLELNYSFDNVLKFSEVLNFQLDNEVSEINKADLDKALFNLYIMAGISYYKAYEVNSIEIMNNKLTKSDAEFFSDTYSKGLREYYFINKLDPKKEIIFPFVQSEVNLKEQTISSNEPYLLIGIGGGKDSLCSVESLKDTGIDIATWSLNHKEQLEPLVNTIGTKHYFVSREIDLNLIKANEDGALNGHVPISAILAFAGTVQALLSGRTDVVVSNEKTASEPNFEYMGVEVNHQYSKSKEFEKKYQEFLEDNFGDSFRYYSFLRPLTELRIAELFVNTYLEKYISVFSSCNKAFKLSSNSMSWCGECPKCAFVFLAFTPFVEMEKLEELFGGKNLLKDSLLEKTYKELLGIEGNKPLECVGEIKESRSAMRMAFDKYPELEDKYVFDIPSDYDYKKLGSDLMPEEIKLSFDSWISQF